MNPEQIPDSHDPHEQEQIEEEIRERELLEKADKEIGEPLQKEIEKIGKEWPQNKNGKRNKEESMIEEDEKVALDPDEADAYFEQFGNMSDEEAKKELGIPDKTEKPKSPKLKRRF